MGPGLAARRQRPSALISPVGVSAFAPDHQKGKKLYPQPGEGQLDFPLEGKPMKTILSGVPVLAFFLPASPSVAKPKDEIMACKLQLSVCFATARQSTRMYLQKAGFPRAGMDSMDP